MYSLRYSAWSHFKFMASQVLVQTQIELWSDPIERTPLCSQTEITGSGKRFERTIVWTMVWFWSDQRSVRSGRSDHSLYSLDHGLGSVWSEVNSVWKVWSQSLQSGPWSGFGLIRGQFGLEGLISSALFFHFFIDGCWLCQYAAIKQRSDQRLI